MPKSCGMMCPVVIALSIEKKVSYYKHPKYKSAMVLSTGLYAMNIFPI